MPTYSIRNKKTGKVIREDVIMTISEMEAFEAVNPKLEVACGAPILGYNTLTKKPDEDFRSLLKKIKKQNIGSKMNTFG